MYIVLIICGLIGISKGIANIRQKPKYITNQENPFYNLFFIEIN